MGEGGGEGEGKEREVKGKFTGILLQLPGFHRGCFSWERNTKP